MKKIGKSLAFCLLTVLFISGFYDVVSAQDDVSVTATVSESTVYTGSRLRLQITIQGDFSEVSRPVLPDFTGFRLLGSIPSTSRQFSYINGATKSSFTYSYFLVAQQTGTYTIPAISITVDGNQHQTQPVTVKVVDRNDAAANTSGSSQPKIFLEMKLSDKTTVPGQQIIADVILYFKEGIRVNSYQPIPGWKAQGFWKEQLVQSGPPMVKPVIIDGVRFNKAQLLQFALFPTKTGELTISPYRVHVSIQSTRSRRDPFSSFFGSFGVNRRRLELETNPITIQVKALPDTFVTNYIGAVGSFTIERKITADSVKVGESIEIVTRVSGTGNIPLLTKPDYKLPDALEVYQPQTTVTINRESQRISGTKTFTDIVVPRNPGPVTIPAVTLSYYNPAKDKFIKKTLPAKTIMVRANPNYTANSSSIDRLSVAPITGLVNWVSPNPRRLTSYWWFWLGLLLPAIGLIAGYCRKRYTEKMRSDYNFARSRKAVETAQKRLQQAVEYADNGNLKEAYNSLQKALTGFIGDRLGLPEAGLSIEQYIEALEERKLNTDLIKNVRMLLNKCATINYAPDSSSDYLKSHVSLAESIIDKLKKEL